MAKKKKKKRKKSLNIPSLFDGLQEETIQGVWAVISFVLAVFFVLSAVNFAGPVGSYAYSILKQLFGVGYFLLPILLFILSISLIGSLRQNLGTSRIFGLLLFFISSLGLIDLVFKSGGGFIGHYISTPLFILFDKTTVIFLIALIIISLLIVFDMRISLNLFRWLFSKFKRNKDNKYDEGDYYDEDDTEYEDEDIESDIEYEDEDIESDDIKNDIEAKKKNPLKNIFSKKEKYLGNSVFSSRGKSYTPPPVSLLGKDKGKPDVGDVKANVNIIKRTFHNFGIHVEMDEVSIGPSITRYALKPAEGIRLSKIMSLQNNLELALAAHPVRIEAPIPGKALVGIEVPNTKKSTVGLAGPLSCAEYKESDKPLLINLGRDITGKSHFANIAKMPHMLIAGSTGSGKSVTIHAIINSLLFRNSPEQLRFIMIDPKRVELTLYRGIPHLLAPVITDAKKTILALKWTEKEMERRYDILESEAVRDIDSYHKNILAPQLKDGGDLNGEDAPEMMPYIVIIIDELADIMQAYPRELESAIVRLAQMSRAVGIHLILSTQRPSVNIITGLIKANIPVRVALQVASQIDSRTILDMSGAEKLLGAGDMLYLSSEMSKPIRIQAPFISEAEVKKVVKFLKKNYGDELPDNIEFTNENASDIIFNSDFEEDEDEDELYGVARETVIRAGKASTSYLQRKLRIGYARAARLIDILEDRGVVGEANGSRPRKILEQIPTGEEEYGDYEEGEEEK